MDLSGVLPHCNFCANFVQPGQPLTQLLCGHQFHTECAILSWADTMECNVCHTALFTTEINDTIRVRERVEKDTKEQQFMSMFKEKQNKPLRDDIKKIKKQVAQLRKARAGFTRFTNAAKREYQQDTDALVRLLKVKEKEFLQKLKVSSEMKAWRSQRAKLSSLITRFNQKHTAIRFSELLSYRSLKLPGRWDYHGLMRIWSWRIRRLARRW